MSRPLAPGERVAAVDIGSNSIRLVVASVAPHGGFEIIDELKAQPRLASGIHETGALDPAAADAAIAALRRMIDIASRRGVSRIRAVATSAVRDASDGAAFAERVRHELGIPLEVISPEHEAALSWRSVAHHFPVSEGRTMVADIGGGSLELAGAVDGIVEVLSSLPLGAVRLTETVEWTGGRDARSEVAAMRRHASRLLRKALPWRDWRQTRLIGSGGTFTNLGRIVAARRGIAAGAVHGTTVSASEVEAVLEWLSVRSQEQRARTPGLNPARADIILAGLAVTSELLDLLDARELTVSAYGLREGLLLEMTDTPEPQAPDDSLRPFRNFLERCRGDIAHAEHVRKLSLALFDQLAGVLGAGEDERRLLEAAALLHDVGQLVSYRRHHKHSAQLILHADHLPLPPRELGIVAQVARYHRRKGPRLRHPQFAALPPADRAVVRRLAALLRIADGLDRGHTRVASSVNVILLDDRCVIRVEPSSPGEDLSLELWGAERKSDVLEKLLDRPVSPVPAVANP